MIKSAAQLMSEVKQEISEVSVSELADNLAQDIVLIDVREPSEYAEGRIAGSVNIPRGVLEFKIHMHPQFKDAEAPLEEINKHEIYVICQSGGRSAFAAASLLSMGFNKVKSVAGGMMAWKEQNLHTEK